MLSNICWKFGWEKLGMRLLLASLEDANIVAPTINIHNTPALICNGQCCIPTVVWEDKKLIAELGIRLQQDIKFPQRIQDIN